MERVKLWSAVIFLLIMAAWSDVLLEPEDGAQLDTRTIAFHKIGMSDHVIVDDNAEFSSPLVVQKPFVVTLQPGIYYWKSSGFSKIRNFSIISLVAINVDSNENETVVENKGNVDVKIQDYGSRLTGAFVLVPDEKKAMNKTEGMVVAKQHE